MVKAKTYLAFIVLLIVAMGVVNAVPQATKFSNQIVKSSLNPQLFAPLNIHVNSIKIAPAAPGNSEPISVSVSIISRLTQKDICGLNASNFKIDGSAFITNVYPISAVAVNQPMTCDYWLSIAPTSPWVTGTNALKLDCIQGGQLLANTTLIFRI